MSELQGIFFAPESDWTPPRMSDLPSWAGAKRIGIDVETRDPQLKTLGPGPRREDSYIVGISFSIEDGPSHYLPMRHMDGNLPADMVLKYVSEQAKAYKGIVCGANLQYDLDFLLEEGVCFEKAKMFRDIQVAEPLIDELQDSFSLENICGRYDLPAKDEVLLRKAAEDFRVDPKKELWKLHSKYVGPYATWDAEVCPKILRRQERIIDEQNLWRVYDLESRLLPVLIRMKRRGVRVSWDRIAQVEQWAIAEAQKALQQVRDITGITLDWTEVNAARACAKPLEATGVKVPMTKSKRPQPSVKKEMLASLEKAGNPVAGHIMRARKMNKVVTTFVQSIKNHAVGDRVHTNFKQLRTERDDSDSDESTGGRFGRISSTHPNLQQQPSPDRDPEIGKRWRSIYIADEGGEWCCEDYSQQEPRWTVHYGELCNLPRAGEMAERYRQNPLTDNHDMMTELIHGEEAVKAMSAAVFKKNRSQGKEIFLGRCYGMGGGKLCKKLGLPTEYIWSKRMGRMIEVAGPEGQAILNKFDGELPFVKMLADKCQKEAEKKGYIITAGGRRCRFPKQENGEYDWTHKALNRLIQGSSADQTKMAMVLADEAGFEIQLQVHDELDLTIGSMKEAKELSKIMIEALPCNVPPRVDIEIGPSWGEIRKAEV